MKKRSRRLERQQNDGYVQGDLKITLYDVTKAAQACECVLGEVADNDDESVLLAITHPSDDGVAGMDTLFAIHKKAPKTTDDEEEAVKQLSTGLALFFAMRDEPLVSEAFQDVITATEMTFGLEPDYIMNHFASLFKKGFKLRLAVPVPSEKLDKRIAEAEVLNAS